MIIEAPFLAVIREHPNDVTSRLVYADWLEEHGDSRSELIRIEEEMRELPVYSDRYWQIKPRRNELRTQAPQEWLQVMRYGTEYQPMFHNGIPDGWKERWRIIREFHERWFGKALGDVGGRSEEIRQAEIQLGRTLPPSLREWVAYAHDQKVEPHVFHEVFGDVYAMEIVEEHEAVSFFCEVDASWQWAVRQDDLAIFDPPVWRFNIQCDEPDHMTPIADSLTSFVFERSLECARGSDGVRVHFADPTTLLHELETLFPPRCQLGRFQIFEAENVLFVVMPWNGLTGELTQDRQLHAALFRSIPEDVTPDIFSTFLDYEGHGWGRFARHPEIDEDLLHEIPF